MLTPVTLLDVDSHVLWIMAGITLWILSPSPHFRYRITYVRSIAFCLNGKRVIENGRGRRVEFYGTYMVSHL